MYIFNKHIGFAGILASIVMAVSFPSCIENDLPYPWVQPNVISIDVAETDAEGHSLLASPVEIDSVSRTIVIVLTEWADIERVEVKGVKLSEGSVCLTPEVFDAPLDLSSPVEVKFGLYDRAFTWTISAVQEIERYFTVASQIGTSVIDVENHTVSALVPTGQSLESVTVRSIKLAGPLSVMEPDLSRQKVDFTSPVTVTVTEFGEETSWVITVTQTDVSVNMVRIDAWTNVAWLYADAQVGKTNGFEYRLASDEEWTVVPREWITENGGSFSARLIHLESQTSYVVRAVSGDDHSAEMEFRTEAEVELPNSGFRDWWLNNGKVWNPWESGGESFWDTGNRGASTLGKSNTVPIEDATSPTGYHGAELQTRFVGASILGKLAAGNMFAGQYVRTDGTDGILAFGRPYVNRPTRLHARIKYNPVNISHASKVNPDFTHMLGKIDTCIVWCALGDWDQPYEIRTKKSDRHLFDPKDAGVIAYGEFQTYDSMQEYADVTIELKYNATDRVPKYILITASASKYGDYFTGGSGSVLRIKDYWLEYDY